MPHSIQGAIDWLEDHGWRLREIKDRECRIFHHPTDTTKKGKVVTVLGALDAPLTQGQWRNIQEQADG